MKKYRKKIIGYLVKDPVTQKLGSNKVVTNAVIALNSQEETKYFKLEAWGNSKAEEFSKFKKGSKCQVSGVYTTKNWIDQNNQSRINHIIKVEMIKSIEMDEIDSVEIHGVLNSEFDFRIIHDVILVKFNIYDPENKNYCYIDFWAKNNDLEVFSKNIKIGEKLIIIGQERNHQWIDNQNQKHSKKIINGTSIKYAGQQLSTAEELSQVVDNLKSAFNIN